MTQFQREIIEVLQPFEGVQCDFDTSSYEVLEAEAQQIPLNMRYLPQTVTLEIDHKPKVVIPFFVPLNRVLKELKPSALKFVRYYGHHKNFSIQLLRK